MGINLVNRNRTGRWPATHLPGGELKDRTVAVTLDRCPGEIAVRKWAVVVRADVVKGVPTPLGVSHSQKLTIVRQGPHLVGVGWLRGSGVDPLGHVFHRTCSAVGARYSHPLTCTG